MSSQQSTPAVDARVGLEGLLPELEIPTNHNPRFAPGVHPTLATGVETTLVAALARLPA